MKRPTLTSQTAMEYYRLPYFGNIDLAAPQDYYSVDIVLQGQKIQLDLIFEECISDTVSPEPVKTVLENLYDYAAKAYKTILNEFKTEATVKGYLEHHLEGVDKNDLDELLTDADKTLPVEEQLLYKLRLERVGLYPEKENDFAIFDYTIGRKVTNYLIVVKFNNEGSVMVLAMES